MKLGLRSIVAAAGATALVASVASAGSSAAGAHLHAKSAVDVGIIYSRTGLLSADGAEYVEGLRLGLDYVTGGTDVVNGHRIDLTLVDDAGDPAKAVSAAKDLIGRGYKILAGTVSSAVALQVAPLAAQHDVLYIAGPAAADAITGLNRNTFRSGRQSYQDVKAVGAFLGNTTGRNVVVLAQDSTSGRGAYAALSAVLGAKGHNVGKILVPLSLTDFAPFAQQAKDENPDLLFVAWAGTTAPAMWRALDQQGVLDSTLVVTALGERATWSAFGEAAAKLTFVSHYVWDAPRSKANDWLVAKMRRRHQLPDLYTPDGFVAAQMIARAVGKADGIDVDKMIAALEAWQFLAPKGIQRIRPQDHAMIQPMFRIRLAPNSNGGFTPIVLQIVSPGNLQPPIR